MLRARAAFTVARRRAKTSASASGSVRFVGTAATLASGARAAGSREGAPPRSQTAILSAAARRRARIAATGSGSGGVMRGDAVVVVVEVVLVVVRDGGLTIWSPGL